MKLKPLGDRVIIKVAEKEEKTKSGIFMPETASKERPSEGKIVAVGPGKLDDNGKRVPLEVKVGDVVVYSKYSGTEIKVDDEEYLILRESDVQAIVGK